MTNVVSIFGPKVFTLEEANALVPLFLRLSEQCDNKCAKILADQRFLHKSGAPAHFITDLDNKVTEALLEWGTKLTKLGVRVMQGGYVLFDTGLGYYYVWCSPEPKVDSYIPTFLANEPYRRMKL